MNRYPAIHPKKSLPLCEFWSSNWSIVLGPKQTTTSLILVLVSLLGVACTCTEKDAKKSHKETSLPKENERDSNCPERKEASYPLNGVDNDMLTANYWLNLLGDKADETLLTPEQIRAHNDSLHDVFSTSPNLVDLNRIPAREEVVNMLRNRLAFMRANMESGEYHLPHENLLPSVRMNPDNFALARELRVALENIPIRCGPFMDSLTSTRGDPRFDRNSCSLARPQEPIEILGRLENGLRLVRTSYTIGFINDDARLSPPVPEQQDTLIRTGDKIHFAKKTRVALDDTTLVLEEGTRLPWEETPDKKRYLVATQSDFKWITPKANDTKSFRKTPNRLSRRLFLQEAFRYLNTPYGWGGQNGGRDCSRLIFDIMRSFGMELPRTSGGQAKRGTYSLLIPPDASHKDRQKLLDAAHELGIVLVHFPGHIMIYLGRDKKSIPRVLHSFAEYLVPCEKGGGETLFEVDRVTVSGLELGGRSSRGSFLERMTHLVVFGRPPGFDLMAFAKFRHSNPPPSSEPERCFDSVDRAIFYSPKQPSVHKPLRLITVATEDMRPARLWFVNPQEEIVVPDVEYLGIGPYAQIATLAKPAPGRWMALLADGKQILACQRFFVRPNAAAAEPPEERPEDAPAWVSKWKWERDTENLYAAFVEHLFSEPDNGMRTWKSLDRLLSNPSRNILHNHLGMHEDKIVDLIADCADLPYFLRAYFSWKLSLPFGYRRCNRGRPGRPPTCGDLRTNEQPVLPLTEAEIPEKPFSDLEAVDYYITRYVRAGVHASSGRTHPNNKNADLYPLPISRDALSPGTVFIDPYGHVIVVAKWVPRKMGSQGMLIGADAQPDGTVGLRRFWRGSFLFSPLTDSFGAGFKAFWPLIYDKETKTVIPMDRKEMAASKHFRMPSKEQYQGTVDDFYHKMDTLIDPGEVDPLDRLKQLVDALEEQVERRLVSVNTGESFILNRSQPIPMPEGYEIFETKGAWENYASPSRDMRLLIAIDTVRRIGKDIRSYPKFFGLHSENADQVAEKIQSSLSEELRSRRFTYTRSDGSEFELSLADVLARSQAFEIAYNPNDCVEIRWGAPEGSEEMTTCQRRAPGDQRDIMETYRLWFRNRKRPPRTPK